MHKTLECAEKVVATPDNYALNLCRVITTRFDSIISISFGRVQISGVPTKHQKVPYCKLPQFDNESTYKKILNCEIMFLK